MEPTLYEQWESLISDQTDDTFKKFWDEYSATETRVYKDLLENRKTVTGTFQELCDTYNADPVIFMGFLDGIDTSLKEKNDFKSFDKDSHVTLDIDYEKLYYNMQAAEADYLYTLPQWDDILPAERRQQIAKEYKRSKTVVKGKKIGRNDPCPCGSGKKYKKCCGK